MVDVEIPAPPVNAGEFLPLLNKHAPKGPALLLLGRRQVLVEPPGRARELLPPGEEQSSLGKGAEGEEH